MKKLHILSQTLLIGTAIALFATSCSKDSTVDSVKTARAGSIDNSVKTIDPDYHPVGAVKGFVLPPQAAASVSLTSIADGSNYNVTADANGLFAIEKLEAGKYTMTVLPSNPFYKGVQLEILVIADQTTEVTVTLSGRGK